MYKEYGSKESIDSLLRGEMASTWCKSFSHELGWLAHGIDHIKGNDVVHFIRKFEVPHDRIITYANIMCDYRPLKSAPYPYDAVSPAASLLESKLLFNNIILDLDKVTRFLTLDIKDFFLKTLMRRPEYMRIHGKYFLEDMRKKYNINQLITPDGYVY